MEYPEKHISFSISNAIIHDMLSIRFLTVCRRMPSLLNAFLNIYLPTWTTTALSGSSVLLFTDLAKITRFFLPPLRFIPCNQKNCFHRSAILQLGNINTVIVLTLLPNDKGYHYFYGNVQVQFSNQGNMLECFKYVEK